MLAAFPSFESNVMLLVRVRDLEDILKQRKDSLAG